MSKRYIVRPISSGCWAIWDSDEGKYIRLGTKESMLESGKALDAGIEGQDEDSSKLKRYLVQFETHAGGRKEWYVHIEARNRDEAKDICKRRWMADKVYSRFKQHNISVERDEDSEEEFCDFRCLHSRRVRSLQEVFEKAYANE